MMKLDTIKSFAQLAMCTGLTVALVCNSIVFSSDVLPALAFFHFNPGLAFGLYILVLMSWFVMYFSSGLPLLFNWLSIKYKETGPAAKKKPTHVISETIGVLNVLLNGFTLMGGIAAFMKFCQQYGLLSAAFLHSNAFLISAIFFAAGLVSSYALTYQRIKAVGNGLRDNMKTFESHPRRITFAFFIAVFAGFSSGLFAYYCTPIVALFHIAAFWQPLAQGAVFGLAFIAAFSLYFVSLNSQLAELEEFNFSKITPSGLFIAIISIVAATAFCFTSYHQFAVLFTITDTRRTFIIAEVCCQWIAFSTAYFYSYSGLAATIIGFAKYNTNIVFIAEHLVTAILAACSIKAFLIPSMIALAGNIAAVSTGAILFSLVLVIDHYIDRNSFLKNQTPVHKISPKPKLSRTPLASMVFGEKTCEAVFKPIDDVIAKASLYSNFLQSKVGSKKL